MGTEGNATYSPRMEGGNKQMCPSEKTTTAYMSCDVSHAGAKDTTRRWLAPKGFAVLSAARRSGSLPGAAATHASVK